MNLGRIPAIFVSSTCYDLKQIRVDIKEFIENQIGYEAILSEFDSFPLDPDIGTVENCLRTVKERADIFVLVIGGRYGSLTDTGKSVTNLEYIYAKAKNIPIYVFVNKSISTMLPVWRKNPDADFSDVVDNIQLFEFVNKLRGQDNIWVYDFETAQDIITTIKTQIAYLFHDALQIRTKILCSELPPSVMQLDGESLKIVLEKPQGWEYLLLGKVLENSICQFSDLKRDLIYGMSFGSIQHLEDANDIMSWVGAKTSELSLIIDGVNALFNRAIPEALGPDGESGNAEHIVYAAQKLGNVYGELIRWGLDFKRVSIDENWQGVIDALSKMCESPISDLENYCRKYKQEMALLLSIPDDNEEACVLDLTLTLSEPDLTEYNFEIEKIRKHYGLRI